MGRTIRTTFTPVLKAGIEQRAFPGETFTQTVRRLTAIALPTLAEVPSRDVEEAIWKMGGPGGVRLTLRIPDSVAVGVALLSQSFCKGEDSRAFIRLVIYGLYQPAEDPLKNAKEFQKFLRKNFTSTERRSLRLTLEELDLHCSRAASEGWLLELQEQKVIKLFSTPISGYSSVYVGGKPFFSWEWK
jgi:hypothetical protein